jgi:aryl sulfotransferase
VFYEQLVADTPHELGRIARHLGLDVAPQVLERVASSHALGEMRKKQPHHVFRGHWGGWREHLDDRQAIQVQQTCGRMMKALGYPLTRSDCDGWTPAALHPPARPASGPATATTAAATP